MAVGRGACMAGGAWQGGMHGRGGDHVWQGIVLGGGACMAGGHACHGRYYGIRSMSGRYASYWNAFLLQNLFNVMGFYRIFE